jgi:hypothetical protein
LEQSLAGYALQLHLSSAQLTSVQKAAGLLQGYHVNFVIFAAAYLVALLCWFKIDSTRPLVMD